MGAAAAALETTQSGVGTTVGGTKTMRGEHDTPTDRLEWETETSGDGTDRQTEKTTNQVEGQTDPSKQTEAQVDGTANKKKTLRLGGCGLIIQSL